MLSAFIRVAARAAAIQLEEAAAANASAASAASSSTRRQDVRSQASRKGKEKAIDVEIPPSAAFSARQHQQRNTPTPDTTLKSANLSEDGTSGAASTTKSSIDRTAPVENLGESSKSAIRIERSPEILEERLDVERSHEKMVESAPRASHPSIGGPPQQDKPDSVLDTAHVEPPLEPQHAAPTLTESEVQSAAADEVTNTVPMAEDDDIPPVLRASKVPSSRIGRLLHYGSLAASMSFGAASESIRRGTGGGSSGSVFMSDANIRRLVASLARMRGAALKLGQFMSIQDNHMLPPEIEKVLQQVQAHANYMPDWQMEQVMSSELGSNWRSLFSSFNDTPIASASIGQVHRAVLASTGEEVAIKIQFPGIASSIKSDLANLSILLRTSALLPKGLYLQNTIAVMKRELEDECDYIREGEAGRKFREFLKDDDFFVVPRVVDDATTGKVLTTEWMSGKPLSRMKGMSQETRDKIGKNILRLCLQELFQFRFMQTDPNWANFLYDAKKDQIQLIDFGASREYTKEFMDGWYRLLDAALRGDRESMTTESRNLGYLTGEESEEMLKAHLDSMALIASPFSHPGPYPFANQTITDSVRALIPIMLKQRLTPPPPETYSLNRKLSGAFLMCARLGANVDCRQLWEDHVGNYQQGPEEQDPGTSDDVVKEVFGDEDDRKIASHA